MTKERPIRFGMSRRGEDCAECSYATGKADSRGREGSAIAARDPARAREFAKANGILRVLGSYDDLIADPDLDAIYNPLPNSLHCEWSIKALRAGKHVFCEKPMASNAEEAARMAEVADETGLLLVEAFHYRYHPLADRIRLLTVAAQSANFSTSR